MKMSKIPSDIFAGNSDSETEIKTQNEYAKGYDSWRKKEELNKLKTKYGEDALEMSESSSSSDDDEDATELTEEVERDFFKTLSYLKTKDPKIYDNNISFFKHRPEIDTKPKKDKKKPMFLKDYERKLLLEKGGVVSEDEDLPRTYAREQEDIKQEIVKLGASVESDSDEDGNIGGILQVRSKTKEETEGEAEYLRWLAGQGEELKDENIKSELKPLKDFWSDPKLDSGEKFLRDYVLKKKYLDKDSYDYVPTYDEIIHDSDENLSGDEEEIKKQEEFEYKYNFRFEEPDQEFIKRYPRTIEKSLRRTDDKRSVKRAETKERKKKEKEQKMADINQLKELKRKEIEEKLEKLKEVTGTADLAFGDEDIDGDFDPEAHDRRMQELFDEQFYEGPESDQKPLFPEIDEELEIENWDHWKEETSTEQEYNPHCEDDDFNMDADFNPLTSSKKTFQTDDTRSKKKRKRKSKVAEALCRPKPKFDPDDKNYEKYFEEYYKLDCEDVIGDIPCRFKYRKVVPNNFGLSVEEILLAKDKELNRWCSLKKMVQRRPEQMERYDQIAYSKKADNVTLKKRLLPSLFLDDKEDENNENREKKVDETYVENEFKSEETPQQEILRKRKRATNAKQLKQENVAVDSKNNEVENRDGRFVMGNAVSTETEGIPQVEESKETPQILEQPVVKKAKKKKKKRANAKQENVVPLVVDNDNGGVEDQDDQVANSTAANIKAKEAPEKLQKIPQKLEQAAVNRANKKNIKKAKAKQLKQENGVVAKNHSEEDKHENGEKINSSAVNIKIEKLKVKKTKKRKWTDSDDNKHGGKKKAKSMKNGFENGISDARLAAFGINPKKYKNKLKYGNKQKI
ncbi:protein KRI1 homolog [Euwallacea similis]|uniref:protein KRI1 homolog n=1 Tax=Euwallacea similis TaxID=1736056 RepID=UPI0034503F22